MRYNRGVGEIPTQGLSPAARSVPQPLGGSFFACSSSGFLGFSVNIYVLE
jgi:hypothetical protein